ncbi:GntR family transcriptional regulator [Pseudoduganella aquatica]|uniref:FCD domain-containing protein n=1 Tax=Pseudoduganella aquatica TaxID=2660641 RepID=A0A7X4KR46_9BURK|nr:GntR family transcriptional regulator [Pseudoduganella aquatica]MYN11006.1 FCD domain-containing protein [Pseudoduganella aquatica]
METAVIPGTFQLDRSRNATVQVFEHLRELIVTLALEPGAVLPRNDLTRYFNLSATPIRDALTRLGDEGLVDIFPQHVTRVRSVDLASARQAQFLRLSVELEIVRTLSQKPEPALAQTLLQLVERQRACLEAGDLKNFTQIDLAFHQQLYQAAQLEQLWHTMRSGSGNLDRLRRLHLPLNGKAQSILEEHSAIARAIGAGDPAAAQGCVRQHLSGTLSELDQLKLKYPSFMPPIA